MVGSGYVSSVPCQSDLYLTRECYIDIISRRCRILSDILVCSGDKQQASVTNLNGGQLLLVSAQIKIITGVNIAEMKGNW